MLPNLQSITFRTFSCLAFVSVVMFKVHAQGTSNFIGFEEYPVGTTPPFVQPVAPQFPATVQDSSTSVVICPPFDGQKFLVGVGTIFIKSPDGQPIQSFDLHFFVDPKPSSGWVIQFSNSQFATSNGGKWETVHRTLDTPVQTLQISAVWGIENNRGAFAIDDLQLTTIPEPNTVALFSLGLCTIILVPKIRSSRMKQR